MAEPQRPAEQAARKIVDWCRAQLADPAEPDFQLPLLTAIYEGLVHRIKAAIERAARAEREAADRILLDMQAEAPAYLQGQADALAWLEATLSRLRAGLPGQAALDAAFQEIGARRLSLSLPVAVQRARVRAGTFEADISAAGIGPVTLDGRPVPVRAFTLRCALGEMPYLQLDVAPIVLNRRTDGTPPTTKDR